MMYFGIRLLGFILLTLFFACSQDTGGRNTTPADSSTSNESAAVSQLQVDLLDASKFKALKKKYQGKVLFINTWATWCLPCKEEFPDLVRLARNYKDSDVAIVGVSVDYPDEVTSKVIPFLSRQQVNFPNFVQNFKEPEDLINLFNIKWRGAVPATFIYDKEGNQRAFLLGKHTFEEFRSEIERIRSDS
jgi:thiol-disulfide isomerase/thioredoxin